uniref:CPG4 domain-containing protein n=1 Tax=Globodera pallida TaxID=36090 RepID=A0A183C6B1_GLOPA
MPPLDPSIPTQSPHLAPSSDSCVGQCAFTFTDQMRSQLGSERSTGLLNLNYNEFLAAFSNSSFFESFCNIYHQFNFCYTKCPQGFMQELLGRSAEIVDHFCVWNYKEIMAKFGCLAGLDRELSRKCLRSCTGHHDAVTSLMQNFKHLALNSDPTEAEKYLGESCEYVTCTLHCDVPAIYNLCGRDTAELVVNLTRKSFDSMERMALDTGAVGKWPTLCDDIRTYAVPKASKEPSHDDKGKPETNDASWRHSKWPIIGHHWLLFFSIPLSFCLHNL